MLELKLTLFADASLPTFIAKVTYWSTFPIIITVKTASQWEFSKGLVIFEYMFSKLEPLISTRVLMMSPVHLLTIARAVCQHFASWAHLCCWFGTYKALHDICFWFWNGRDVKQLPLKPVVPFHHRRSATVVSVRSSVSVTFLTFLGFR